MRPSEHGHRLVIDESFDFLLPHGIARFNEFPPEYDAGLGDKYREGEIEEDGSESGEGEGGDAHQFPEYRRDEDGLEEGGEEIEEEGGDESGYGVASSIHDAGDFPNVIF